MGFLTSIETRATLEDPRTPLNDGFTLLEVLGGGRPTATGRTVNANNAKRYPAVWAAINLISKTVGTLPLKLYTRQDNGGKREERSHPLWAVLHDMPNPHMTAISYREALQGHLLTRGNAYSEIITNGRGQVTGLWPLNPDRVEVRFTGGGNPFFAVSTEGGEQPLAFDKVLHIPGMGFDGVRGWSPVKLAREAIALGLATEEYGARFFQNNSTPRGILQAPNSVSDTALTRLKEGWQKAQGGLDNAHRVAVLEEGIEWQQMGLNAEDSQFLETRKFQVREIARIYGVPPHKIGDLEDATFSNIEEQNIEFVQDSIMPWLKRWEQAMTMKLLSDTERSRGLFVEFNVDGRLRGDSERRSNMYQVRFNTGSLTPNDIRRMENENPIDAPGADEPWVQINMMPLSKAQNLSVMEQERLLRAANGEPEKEQRALPVEKRQPGMRLRLRQAFRPMFDDATQRMVRGEIRNLRRALDSEDSFLDFLSDYYFNEHPEFARSVMLPVFSAYADSVAQAAAEELGEDEPGDVTTFAEGYTDAFVNRYSASSRRQLQALIEEEDEETPVEERVDQRLTEWDEGSDQGRPRAERVSSREIVELGEAAFKAVAVGAGVLTLRWVTLGDSCPFCRRLNGKIVGVQNNFIEEGEAFEGEGGEDVLTPSSSIGHPPAHRGCDCTTIAGA